MPLPYQKALVSSWFERRKDGQSTFDVFIYTWIALNAALSARYPRGGDGEKVQRFAEELAPFWPSWLQLDAVLRQGVTTLVEQSPIFREPPGQDGERRQVLVVADDARSVMAGIYAIRNNLFHGAKEFDAMRDHVLVKSATVVVERSFINSGLYDMAKQPERDLTEPLTPLHTPAEHSAS